MYDSEQNAIKISINGGVFDSYVLGYPPNQADGNFWIGFPSEFGFCDVDVDELGFWKRLLSQDEIDYLYNSGTGRTLYP